MLIKESEFSAQELCEEFKKDRIKFQIAIQEVAVAIKVEILYCYRYLDWDMLEIMSDICCEPEMIAFLQVDHDGYHAVDNLDHLRLMIRLRKFILDFDFDAVRLLEQHGNDGNFCVFSTSVARMRKRLNLGRLLSDSAGFQASDLRDKIFASLGLTTDESERMLRPDYFESISIQDVYLDATRFIFAGGDPLCVLPFAGIGYKDRLVHLPSWVPD